MLQSHTLDISVNAKGELEAKVHYRDRVPDLLAKFSDEVQRRARSWFWLRSPYERKLWRAAKLMPPWARETIRQHIYHERAQKIAQVMEQRAAKRQARALQQQVRLTAMQSVPMQPVARVDVNRPVASSTQAPATATAAHPVAEVALAPETPPTPRQLPSVGVARHASGSAWAHPTRGALTLTQRLALETEVPQAMPVNVLTHTRGR